MELDELFKEVKQHIRTPDKKGKEGEEKAEPSTLYSNPENWTHKRFLALVHQDSQTLLGVFSELLHKSVDGCRRLVRADGSAASAVEQVSGDWLPTPKAERERSTRASLFHPYHGLLSLDNPQVNAWTDVLVEVRANAIISVTLTHAIVFGGEHELLSLPEGIDVLKQLSHQCKINLRKEFINVT